MANESLSGEEGYPVASGGLGFHREDGGVERLDLYGRVGRVARLTHHGAPPSRPAVVALGARSVSRACLPGSMLVSESRTAAGAIAAR